jgi:uncharacterized membrane protein YphA (DoxX/SURF4 family)
MRLALAALIVVHGLIHLMGFAKAFDLASLDELKLPISRPVGVLWFLTCIAMLAAAGMLLLGVEAWVWAAGGALLASQALIVGAWSDARFGTIANLIILVPLLVTWAQNREGGFRQTYERVVSQAQVGAETSAGILGEEDLTSLPIPLQRYLRVTGSLGKPRVSQYQMTFAGSMRREPDSPWLDVRVRQTNTVRPALRAFLIESSLYGVPFDGLHVFEGPHSGMKIRVAGLFQVVDARGPEMDQAETVTLLNDMCLLAPSALVSAPVEWTHVSDSEVAARFSHNGRAVSALLKFDSQGFLRDFSSDDRFLSRDGKEYTSYRWTTPVQSYAAFGDRKVVSNAEAIWHLPSGPFAYARFELTSYDVR